MTDLEKELEKALAGKSADQEIAPLADTAANLRAAFMGEVPEARNEQLLFTSAVGLRKRSGLGFRLLVPAIALGSFLFALVFFGRTAAPGESLYPVRGALKAVGLAEGPVEEVNEEIAEAQEELSEADSVLQSDPDDAADAAYDAIEHLDDAQELLPDLNDDDRSVLRVRINSLRQRARRVIAQAALLEQESVDNEGPSSSEDNSGPGGGGGDDNSGSGSDDSGGDDSSGPGSGDSDDNSGSGSSGSGSGDDSSGSGSSGSGSGDDSSGSGSDGDDSSGSGSSGSGSG